MYVHTCVCIYMCVHVCVHMCAYVCSYMCTCVCVCVCVCIVLSAKKKYKKQHSSDCWWLFRESVAGLAEKAMAPHSNPLAWKIPWTEEPGRLQSMGSQRVRHDWATSLSLFTFMRWRRKWQPTPVFLPGESQEGGSLVGCRLWGHTESDTTEAT